MERNFYYIPTAQKKKKITKNIDQKKNPNFFLSFTRNVLQISLQILFAAQNAAFFPMFFITKKFIFL
jgi:hypothetical protein